MAGPNPLLKTKALMQVVREVREPSSFLLDLFFFLTETFRSEKVEIDVVRDDREIAAFTHPNSEPNVRQRTQWERQTHTPPYIFESLQLRPTDLNSAQPGEHIYQDTSLRQRFVRQVAEDTRYLQSLVKRTLEWWASKLLDGGAVTIVGKGIPSYTIDFSMPAGNKLTLTGGDRWTEATATPLQDLRTHRTTLGQESGLLPNAIIMGNIAAENFLARQEVKDYLDSRRGSMIIIDPKHLPRGVAHIGNFEGAEIFTYDEQYKSGGVMSRYIDSKRVYFGSTDAQTMRAHGAILNMNALHEAEWFLSPSTDQRGRVHYLDIESAPFLALSQSSAFGYIVVAS